MTGKSNILDFPELRQTYNYDCGASALQSVLTYYGIDEREDTIMKKLKTVSTDFKNNGTDISAIVSVAEEYKLDALIEKSLSSEDLMSFIDNKIPVILLLQAWNEEWETKDVDYSESYTDGHYVVAIGYTKNTIIFEDPSSFVRTYLSFKELQNRWHGLNDKQEPDKESVSIIIDGTPKYKSNKIIKMG